MSEVFAYALQNHTARQRFSQYLVDECFVFKRKFGQRFGQFFGDGQLGRDHRRIVVFVCMRVERLTWNVLR